jgi:hypothetical protein
MWARSSTAPGLPATELMRALFSAASNVGFAILIDMPEGSAKI